MTLYSWFICAVWFAAALAVYITYRQSNLRGEHQSLQEEHKTMSRDRDRLDGLNRQLEDHIQKLQRSLDSAKSGLASDRKKIRNLDLANDAANEEIDSLEHRLNESEKKRIKLESSSQDTIRRLLRAKHEATARDYNGAVVICDRRQEEVSFDLPDIKEEDPHGKIYQLFGAEAAIGLAARFEWSQEDRVWTLKSDRHLGDLLRALPETYGDALFIHTVSSSSECGVSCQASSEWTTCKCSCAGKKHGAGPGSGWTGWKNIGWRHLSDGWVEKYFVIEKDWQVV